MKHTISLLSLVVSAFLLAACGGGGGGQPSISSTHTNGNNTAQPDTPPTQTDGNNTAQPDTPSTQTDGNSTAQPDTPSTQTDGNSTAQPDTPSTQTDRNSTAQPDTPSTQTDGNSTAQPDTPSTQTDGNGIAQPDTSSAQTREKGWDTYKPIWSQSKDIPNVGKYNSKTIWLSINNKKYQTGDIDISHLPLGLNTLKYESQFTESEPNQAEDTLTEKGTMRLYKQKYSVIVGNSVETSFSKNQGKPLTLSGNEYGLDDDSPQGQLTPFDQLPQAGKFTYNGSAFTANEEGQLTYTVDFDKREGSGNISGLNYFGDISLHTGKLQKNWLGSLKDKDGGQIWGQATSANSHRGEYELNFFGPNAEEIGGRAYFENNGNNSISIGIAGSREPLK